ncbi:MAG: LEA type 2 family protein [Longimicrobiales bacterium]
MRRTARSILSPAAAAVVGLATACAGLGLRDVIQAPRFEVAGRQAELRLVGPSLEHPLGAAGVRLWTRVQNPNPIALTLAAVDGTFYLEDTRAATVDFPLGLPMPAGQDTVIPLDLTIGLRDVPDLAGLARRWFEGSTVDYRLDGTVAVDAGPLGQPSFGPSTLLTGELRVLR